MYTGLQLCSSYPNVSVRVVGVRRVPVLAWCRRAGTAMVCRLCMHAHGHGGMQLTNELLLRLLELLKPFCFCRLCL